jgi:arylsulfatase A
MQVRPYASGSWGDADVASRRGDASKVIVGCAVGFVLCILVCGGVLFWAVPQGLQWGLEEFGNVMEREMERDRRAAVWNPPDPEIPPADLFPETIGLFTRVGDPDQGTLEEYGVVDPVPHALYRSGEETIDLYAFPASDQERRAIYISLRDAIESGSFTMRVTSGGPDMKRFYFYVRPPERTGWFWWSQDWMIVAISSSDEDPEPFLNEYLDAIDQRGPPEAEPPAAEGEQAPPAEAGEADDPLPEPDAADAEPAGEETAVSTPQAGRGDRPNFIVIMADDMGYGDLSSFGSPGYETPHLDRLADEGMKLTDFHSNGPVCSPTRAALVTGRYQQRAGIDGVIFADPEQNRHHGLQPEELTFAEVLSRAGYATGIFGKWHLGYDVKYNPVRRGFDRFVGFVSGNVCYQSHLDRMGIFDWWHDDQPHEEPGYTTHLITRHSIEFIERHRNRPFCVYVAHECVHSPYQGPDDPPVRKPGRVGDLSEAVREDIPAAYAEMMTEMDRGIGETVAKLKELGLDRRTLVLFFSDNGANRNGSNAPFRGFKGSLYEGGHRVPCIAWQPGTVPAGTASDVPAMTIDVMPTLLDLAAAPLPADHALDGVSLAPVLTGQGTIKYRPLFFSYRDKWAIRSGPWKLISGERGASGPQLFRLDEDPEESEDLASEHPDLVRKLTEQFHAWQADVSLTATPQPPLEQ